jgi:hypothetical protein
MRYAKDSISLRCHSEILMSTLGIHGGCLPASFYSMSLQNAMAPATLELIKRSPRFGILLVAIALAMIFTIMDIVASV